MDLIGDKLKKIIKQYMTRVYVLGIAMFWTRIRLILARAARRGIEWAWEGPQNKFMPKNINSVTINITLEGIEKTKIEKMTTKQSEQSREYLQVEWLLFSSQWKCTIAG